MLLTEPTLERLRRCIAAHFDPRTGSPYWLERERALGVDVRGSVRAPEDLELFGPFDRRAWVERPLEEFVPRPLWERREELLVSETGGTTGRPVRCVFTPEELRASFGEPFVTAARARGFPTGGQWLFVGPSGPHVIGRAAALFARTLGALEPFCVDFDPRWARAQERGSLGERLYVEHVLDQALDVLARERVDILFTTPPVALALATELSDAQLAALRGVHVGGMVIDPESYRAIRAAFANAVVLPGYGNSSFGVLMEVADAGERGEPLHLDYFARSGGPHVRIVEESGGDVQLDRDVVVGACGRVVMTRFDESFLLPNVVERDRAEAIVARPRLVELGWAERGVRNPWPVARGEREGGALLVSEWMELRRLPRRPGERLELAVTCPPSGGPVVVLFGPHPLLGGDLDNNVQRSLARACGRMHRTAVRFNYRGVGASEAIEGVPRYEFWADMQRRGDFGLAMEDGHEALRRAQRLGSVALAIGYSFGAWVALVCARTAAQALPLVLIAPPLGRMNFSALADYPAPTTLVLAGRDALDPVPAEAELRARFPRSRIVLRPGDDHFFRGAEESLAHDVLAGVEAFA